MAPKKKSTPNAFMIFMFEWKDKYGKHMNIQNATTEAGKLWANMSAQERGPYNEKAKKGKVSNHTRVEKLTCTGVPVSFVEKEKIELENRERTMKRQIETTVRNSLKDGELDLQSYYFIMVNYFTKTLKGGVYVPAEISVAEYSLKEGVNRKYHCFINPGVNIYGHHYEAQHHSETTHKLPLPPKAMGETNLGRIYNDVLNFIRNKETGEYPPVYTNRDSMPIVESVLDFLKADVGANNVDVKIYSIQYLFYIMKEATCEMGELDKPKSFYITDAYFERDFFEYQTGIACQYHEDMDKSKYCTQSCVTRWGFMFSDYMCRDIAISLIPGRHVPESTNLAAIINPAPSTCDDTKSCISGYTESSVYTNAVSEHKIYCDDEKTTISDMTSRSYGRSAVAEDRDDYSYSGESSAYGRKKPYSVPSSQRSKATRYTSETYTNRDDSDDGGAWGENPWASRSRHTPREPDTSKFNIDYSRDEGDAFNYSLNSTATKGHGRGKLFNP